MGAVWARFKKKKTAIEELEEIERKTKNIEEYRRDSQQRQKRYIGALILYSIILYVIFCIVFYFYYFPAVWTDRILHSLPLLLFPVLIWLIKRMLQAYFRHRINQSEDQLTTIRRRRKKILEEVMDKEKYNIAKEILEKFDPSVKEEKEKAAKVLAQENIINLRSSGSDVRQRLITGRGGINPPASMRPTSVLGAGRGRGFSSTPGQMLNLGYDRPLGPPMPRPILPRNRNTMDRLIEYIVGDGPNNRLALICKRCFSHNGMALKEEFEYLTYRCCYCHTINPARKQRPQAPKLESSPEQSEAPGESEDGSEGELSEMDGLEVRNNTVTVDHELVTYKLDSGNINENDSEIKLMEKQMSAIQNNSKMTEDELSSDIGYTTKVSGQSNFDNFVDLTADIEHEQLKEQIKS